MVALGKIFEYTGVADKAAVSEINLVLGYPVYSYEYSEAVSGVVRNAGDSGTATVVQDLRSHEYHVEIPAQAFLGPSADPAFMCHQYVQKALAQTSLNLEAITMPIDVVFSDPETGARLGKQQLTALYLLKTREQRTRMSVAMVAEPGGVDAATSTVVIVNYPRYQKLLNEFGNLTGSSDEYLFITLVRDLLAYADETTHVLSRLTEAVAAQLISVLQERGVSNAMQALDLVRTRYPELFEFTITAPELRLLQVAGMFSVKAPEGVEVTRDDLARYDVSVECTVLTAAGTASFRVQHLDWSASQPIEQNQTPFSFGGEEPIFMNAVEGLVTVKVKDPGSMLLWSRSYKAGDPALKTLTIEVPLQRPTTLGDAPAQGALDKNKKLRGKVVCLDSEVSLKDLTVFVRAQKASDGPWSIVSVGTTDGMGNFTMPYPYGVYVAAQAVVSLSPKSPATIPTDAVAPDGRSISDDFLYLLVENVERHEHAEGKDGDCGCGAQSTAPRLPDHADLIGSDQYSQDIGGSCINLSAPNRTLREYAYHAIVRTSDPDVANYTLKKTKDGSFDLVGGATKIKRAPVDLSNPIAWQDSPDHHSNASLYQAVTVATGHVLHYRSEFKADGYSIGDLLYSLPLAPGQKKQIVVIDSLHKLQAAESQTLIQGERLAANLVDEREITDQLGGGISEALSGSSSATTSGVSAGLGVGASFGAIGGSLGVAGGYANSNSSASQNSSRNVAQHFGERLRQSIMQNADSYRQQNASVVTTVQEGQHYSATTEVVANHNHCHSLTMMYFEVLRHFAIYQDLASVEECVFVPLLMTNFTPDNISKWRDVLARHLLPVHANTYLQPFNSRTSGRAHPLLKAFDAIDRIRTKYANVDFPATTYDDEVIRYIKGTITLRTSMPRPKTRYDRVKSLPIVSKTVTHEEFDAASTAKSVVAGVLTGGMSLFLGSGSTTKTVSEQVLARAQIFDAFMQLDANYATVPPAKCIRVVNFRPVTMTVFGQTIEVSGGDFFEDSVIDKKLWTTYASLLGYSDVYDLLEYYFKGRLISEWDEIYNKDIAPVLFQKVVDSIRIDNMSLDLTTNGRYKGGEVVMRLTANGTTNLKRKQLPELLNMKSTNALMNTLVDCITLDVDRVNLSYSTAHYHGPLYSGYVGNDLLDGVQLYAPENDAEKRNPRKEDLYLAERLIEHLNSNLDHYNKVLWLNLDPDRRYMLLDGFNVQVFDDFGQPIGFRSLASVVKNRVMSVVGNSLVFPVAAGYKVSKSYIAEKAEDGTAMDVSLLDHYRPLTPPAPYRVSVPSRGVFLEAMQGSCDACEKVKEGTSQDWTKFTTDEPTPISAVSPAVPTVTDWKAAFKDFATPIVNIQNAPGLPAPGAGLAGLNELLGKSGIFKDITGLDANQENVLRTYLSNQENAKAFAEMAKEMVMQGHNTQNSEKILTSLQGAKAAGAITQDDYSKLVKTHFQQQIDGGAAAKAEKQSTKPTLTDAAVKAVDQGKTVKAQKIDAVGAMESVEITSGAAGAAENVLAKIPGVIVPLKQDKTHACWAAVATMLMNWKQKKSMSVVDAMTSLGTKYLQIYNDNTGIMAADKPGLVSALGMIGEAPATYTVQQYIDWVNDYGPIWVTTDDAAATGEFAAHARILIRITGTGTPDGVGTKMTFIDPKTGTEITQSFLEFESAFEQMVTDNESGDLYVQVVRFADKVITAGEGGTMKRWPHLDETTVFDRIEELKKSPNLITQGALGLCGEATFIRHVIQRDPALFESFATALWGSGQGFIGNLQIDPDSDLRNADYPAIVAKRGSKTPAIPPQADWMILSALRDSQNEILDYEGTPEEDFADGSDFSERVEWYKKTGLYTSVKGDDDTSLNHIKTITKTANNHISLRINVALINPNASGKHVISLESSFTIDVPKDKVTFNYWTWGNTSVQTCNTTVTALKAHYLGAIIAEFA